MPKCRHSIRISRDDVPEVQDCAGCGATLPAAKDGQYLVQYAYTYVNAGIILRSLKDGKTAFLQGEDATRFAQDIEPLRDVQYPYGPFKSYEEHLDYVMSQYEYVGGEQ